MRRPVAWFSPLPGLHVSLSAGLIGVLLLSVAEVLWAQAIAPAVTGRDTVSVRIVDTELRSAVALLARYVDKPVLIAAGVGSSRVTLETSRAVARGDVLRLLRGLVESQGLRMTEDTVAGLFRVEPQAATVPVPTTALTGVPGPAAGAAAEVRLYIVRLRHARASDVAATINALYGRSSAIGELGGRAETLNEQVRRGQQFTNPRSPSAGGETSGAPALAPSAGLSAENAIVPDPGSNSLLVRGTVSDSVLVSDAVRALDVRPLQVLIEVIIAEVRKDRSLSYGLDVTVPQTTITDHPSFSAGGTQSGLGLGDFALRVMRKGPRSLDATLRAAASRGDARILSRPVLLAINNESAEILVGSQRPFVQVQRSLPTEAASRDQVVQYRDVGTRLVVRPTISSDGYIALQVTQEVNAATSETQFDAPIISTRKVQTRLVVRDSQTVVLGGLSDRQRDNSQRGVPFLSAIPWIGGFFGQSVRRTTETEFFLFLTPRILRDDDDVERLTTPLKKASERAEP
jgi:general secretion pathway protein D